MKPKKLSTPKIRKSRIVIKTSAIHGKGVFVAKKINKGAAIVEYKGERISWKKAESRHPHDPNQPNHTFYFSLEDGRVIDAKKGGNAARWINHSCKPNCEAEEIGEQVFIKAIKKIKAGEELTYDYGLTIDEPYTKALKAEFPCWCGAKTCRGTLLSPNSK